MLKCEECGQELVDYSGCIVCVSTWCGQILRPMNYRLTCNVQPAPPEAPVEVEVVLPAVPAALFVELE